MLIVQCRLCSSSTALVSLFGGKAKTNRDYIRKLVEITTGIKFQKNDVCKCVCFACIIQIYNFYIFRIQSIENDRTLQALAQEKEEKVRSFKGDVVDLDDIILPSVEELKDNLSPWFISKQKYCERSNEAEINNFIGSNNDKQEHEIIDSSTQTDLIEYTSIGTQYELHSLEAGTQTCKISIKTKKIQCGLLTESKESATETFETNIVKKSDQVMLGCPNVKTEISEGHLGNKIDKNKKIQCDLCNCGRQAKLVRTGTRLRNKNSELLENNVMLCSDKEMDRSLGISCSCNALKSEIDTQTDELHTESVEIQCELIKSNQNTTDNVEPVMPIDSQEIFFKENQSKLVAKGKSTDNDKTPVSRYTTRRSMSNTLEELGKTPKKVKNAVLDCKETSSQTEISFTGDISMETLNIIGIVNELSIKGNTEDCSTQTDPKEVQNFTQTDTENSVEDLSKVRESNCEIVSEGKTETDVSHFKDCASKALNLDIKNEMTPIKRFNFNNQNQPLISPDVAYVSPRSSSLLTIKDKTQHVIICPQCDTTVYSNSEFKLHKRSHMQCNFCKKRFRSLKKTKLHLEFQCDVQRLMKAEPVVMLIRLESLTDIQKKYPECVKSLRNYCEPVKDEDVKKVVRIRSRSVSDTDSVINCTACKGCVSVINKVTIGVDKSIQVNFILDSDLVAPLRLLYKCGKRDMNDCVNGDVGPLKKIKLSPDVVR